MTGFVTVKAADLLRLHAALVADNCNEAYHVLRTMADPAMGVALSNDGNHWADWQRVAATAKQEDGAVCDCHERMGNDFYFLPADRCLKGDPAQCTDAVRKVGKMPELAAPYGQPKEQPDCFTEPDAPVDHSAAIIAADEKLNGPSRGLATLAMKPDCHHHRYTKQCPVCSELTYQLHVDNRPAGALRDTWREAACDAVEAGLAVWYGPEAVKFDNTQGGSIERLPRVNGFIHAAERIAKD